MEEAMQQEEQNVSTAVDPEEDKFEDGDSAWEDGVKEYKTFDEMKDECLSYKMYTYGDTKYCLPSMFRLVRDKFEGMRLRKVIIEGLTAEDVTSPEFFRLVTPCEAFFIVRPTDGEERTVYLRYKSRDIARQRRWMIKQAYINATCMWGPDITDPKLKELQKVAGSEVQMYHEWKLQLQGRDVEKKITTDNFPSAHRFELHGILVNQVPADLPEERLWELFPTARDVWISHNFTLDVTTIPINHRYAFVEYAEATAAGTALEGLEVSPDLEGLLFYNYAHVSDATMSSSELRAGPKVLSDQERLLLLQHMVRLLEFLGRCEKYYKTLADLNFTNEIAKKRRDMTQRRKDVSRMIDRSVTILNEDKKRRLEISEEEFKDTEDQQTFIDGLLDACRDILGKANFDNYCKPVSQHKPSKREEKYDYSPAKRPRYDSTGNRGGGGKGGRGRGGNQQGRGGRGGGGGGGWNAPGSYGGGRGGRQGGRGGRGGRGGFQSRDPAALLDAIKQGLTSMTQSLSGVGNRGNQGYDDYSGYGQGGYNNNYNNDNYQSGGYNQGGYY